MDAIESSDLLENVDIESIQQHLDTFIDLVITFGTKMFVALLVLWVTTWIVKRIVKLMDMAMTARKVEVTLHKFLLSIINIALRTISIIIFASMIGIETASLIALLGAAGLAIGLALQGSLANFAGGIIILFFRPFKAGDVIEAQGFEGTIHEIQIFNTIMITYDNRKVFIPNGLLSNGCLINDFSQRVRRVDMKFGVSYSDSVPKVKEVIQSVLDADERILKKPAADIWLAEHGDSSINFFVRPWVKSDDYWQVYFGIHEEMKLAFDREGISIPFPQRDVHMIPVENKA
ncbi:mechanosensitive ion channel family protein [Thalassotalea crassostreae]|uniref:mechanosensitive ion channel family protein n=1 Tax=Thalassotalea crassostreae TaxID=1763536 RepID=UPI000837C994|nr:mechanosensitive ion channel domain-containing protein [Thalassotalea crassostreae]